MKQRQRGIGFLGAMVIVALIAGIAAAALALGLAEGRDSDRVRGRVRSEALANAGLEHAVHVLKQGVANSTLPSAPSWSGSLTVETGAIDTDVNYTVRRLGPLPALDVGGMHIYRDQWEIEAWATFQGIGPNLLTGFESHARTSQVVETFRFPIFQFLSFYNYDLEIFNGPPATFTGRIHTNANLYLGTNSSATYDTSLLTASGEIYRHRLDNGTLTTGPVHVRQRGTGNFVDWPNTLESMSGGVPNPAFAGQAAALWNGTVQHHAQTMLTPELQSLQPSGYFHTRASELGAGNMVIADGQAFFNGSTTPISSAGWLQQSHVYDHREGTYVTVTQADLGALRELALQDPQNYRYPAGGLLYAYRSGASSLTPEGIKLVNASELGNDLTIVTPDPLYVKGDYNTTQKKKAALISDAVNLLSNSWDNSKSPAGPLPVAGATTYNAAMLTGTVETVPNSAYNGGLENLPRFHENWTGVTCAIRGSFASIHRSQIAIHRWNISGNYYMPPVRDWVYEADFDVTGPPPFTPNAILSRVVVTWQGERPWVERAAP